MRNNARAHLFLTMALLLSVAAHAQPIAGENNLIVAPSQAAPGTQGHVVEIIGINNADVKGYSIALSYGLDHVTAIEVNIDDTISEAVGAEFVNFQDYPNDGFFIFAVLLDLLPPYDGQVIPGIPDFELIYANFVCDISETASGIDFVPLQFVEGVGSPPVSNVFVIDFDSVTPNLVDGGIEIIGTDPFIRGDVNLDSKFNVADAVSILSYINGLAPGPECVSIMDINDDGVINQADPIFELQYLFLAGPIIPPPFPTAGLDPTPDSLPCD